MITWTGEPSFAMGASLRLQAGVLLSEDELSAYSSAVSAPLQGPAPPVPIAVLTSPAR